MAREQRLDLLRRLEAHRGTRVVCYLTSDRQGASGKIAADAVPWLYSHLRELDQGTDVDLLIYSTGGVTMAGYRIAMLLHQVPGGGQFSVLVPYKAHSAATLICLGAGQIVMSAAGELSPIDPSTQSPFNPSPRPDREPAPVQVEDVIGYFDFAEERAGALHGTGAQDGDEELLRAMVERAFCSLVEQVHPLALGSVHRARKQIRMLARKLLKYHISDDDAIETIIQQVTQELYSHDYAITRDEAVEMGLPICIDPIAEDLVWSIYQDYAAELRLQEPYSPEEALGSDHERVVELDLAVVESVRALQSFHVAKKVNRTMTQLPTGQTVPAFQEQLISHRWEHRSA